MPTAILSPNAKQQFLDDAGDPASGYQLFTYLANAAPTLATTYFDRAGTVPNSNPIILDARGEATIYLTPGVVYDYVLKTPLGATVWTQEDVSADAGDADAVVFLQAGTGAVSRTSQDKLRERISVFDYMSEAEKTSTILGTGDHTNAFQRAAAACILAGVGSHLHIPKGVYNISSTINIQFSGTVSGDGSQDTIIRKTVAGIDHFSTVGSFGQVAFTDMQLGTTVTATDGAGILLDTVSPTDGPQQGARVYNIRFLDLYRGFEALNAAYWVVDSCTFLNTVQDAIYSDCTQNFDAGDNSVVNCLISGGVSGNGMRLINNARVVNNKILGHQKGIYIAPSSAAGTRVDFQIIGNSIENQFTFGIQVEVTLPGTGVANSIIQGNQLAAFGNGSQCIAINGPVGGFVVNGNLCVLLGDNSIGIALVANGTGSPATSMVSANMVTGGPAGSVGIFAGGTGTILDGNYIPSAATRYQLGVVNGVIIRNTEVTFAELTALGAGMTAQSGSVVFCTDGTAANPVAGGGVGCLAKRIAGAWVGN